MPSTIASARLRFRHASVPAGLAAVAALLAGAASAVDAAGITRMADAGIEEHLPVTLLQTGSRVMLNLSVAAGVDGPQEQEPAAQEMQRALQEYLRLSFQDGEDCPTTYVYDLPEFWELEVPLGKVREMGEQLLQKLWGNACGNGGVHHMNQFSMPALVLLRLMTSKRCKVTSDPNEADLLLVPYQVGAIHGAEYCPRSTDPDPTSHLVHLNAENAHKHLFLLGKGHQTLASCGSWWKNPTGLLRRSIRVAYSMPVRAPPGEEFVSDYGPVDSQNLTLGKLAYFARDFDDDAVDYPHTFSVPYPATGALGSLPKQEPWRDSESARPILAYFMGGVDGKYMYGEGVRQKIVADCEKVGHPACAYVPARGASAEQMCEDVALKQQALFCLEPGGNTPYRKSAFDDLALGCIPVVFSPYMQLVAPWHWGHWRNESQVVINGTDYLQGKVDLFHELKKIAASPRLQQMRRSIAAHAHSTQYSQRDFPGDGVERLLLGAKHAAQQWERSHRAAGAA